MLFPSIPFRLIISPNGSDAHVNLCPQPHLSLLLTLSLYLNFQTTGLTTQLSTQHIHPWQMFTPMTNSFSSRSFLMQHQGLMSTQRFWVPSKGSVQWGRQDLSCSLGKEGMQPGLHELQTSGSREQHWTQPCAFLSSPGSALLSAPCERSHCSHLGLFLPRKPRVYWQVNSIAHSCSLLSAF